MLSMFENMSTPPPNDKVTVHILHDNTLTDDNRDKLTYIAGKYNQTVKFYNVEILCKERIAEFKKFFAHLLRSRWTLAIYYPFFAPLVFSEDIKKFIYLDTDTIVNLDIATLWKIELGEKAMAVIPKISIVPNWHQKHPLVSAGLMKGEDYFNSGIYVVNVEKFKNFIPKLDETINLLADKQLPDTDEHILNCLFSRDALKLEWKFNAILPWLENDKLRYNYEQVIAHYFQRSVGIDFKNRWTALWFKYFMKTPWFNEKMLANMFGETLKIYNEQRDRMVWLTNLLSSRRRAFCVSANYADVVRKNFEIKDGEDFIAVEPGDAEEKFVELVNQARNKSSYSLVDKSDGKGFSFVEGERKVFIIFNQNYGKFKNALVKEGLKEWQDFFNGQILLSQKNGGAFDSWRIVRNM